MPGNESTGNTPSPEAQQTYQDAVYLITTGKMTYDAELGILSADISREVPPSIEAINADPDCYLRKERISSSPGEVMADERFYWPGEKTDKSKLDLAFELGFLFGRQREKEHPSNG